MAWTASGGLAFDMQPFGMMWGISLWQLSPHLLVGFEGLGCRPIAGHLSCCNCLHYCHCRRSLMGVCPQFDVLWGELTGVEHLRLYGTGQGGQSHGLAGGQPHGQADGQARSSGHHSCVWLRLLSLSFPLATWPASYRK